MRLVLKRGIDTIGDQGPVTEWTEVGAKNSWVDVLSVPTVASYDPESDQAIREVPFVETTSVLSEFVKGVVVGSSGTWSSFSGELAISLVRLVPVLGAWPDVRDTISKLWKYGRAGLTAQDKFELSLSVLGIVAEFGGPVDYIVDAVKLSFKALKVTTGARFAQVSLAVIPFLQELLDAMFSYEVARKSGPSGPPPTLGGNPEGEISNFVLDGAEGEPPAVLLQRVLERLDASSVRLPARVRIVLERAIKLFRQATDAPASFFDLLSDLQGAMQGRYKEFLGEILDSTPRENFANMLLRLKALTTDTAERVLAVDSLVAALTKEKARGTTALKQLLTSADPEKLGEMMSAMGRLTKNLNGDAVLVGFTLRNLVQSGVIKTPDDLIVFFKDVDDLVATKVANGWPVNGIKTVLHRVGNNSFGPFVFGGVNQLRKARELDKLLADPLRSPYPPGATAGFEVPFSATIGDEKIYQMVDIPIRVGNTIIKLLEVKTFNYSVSDLVDPEVQKVVADFARQLIRHLKIQRAGQSQGFEYIVKDQATKDRMIAAYQAMKSEANLDIRKRYREDVANAVDLALDLYGSLESIFRII